MATLLLLERAQQLDRRASISVERPLRVHVGRRAPNLAQGNATLKVTLHVAPLQRRLPRMDALQHERLAEIDTLRSRCEQSRPEVVVLALEELGVVAQPPKRFAVGQHGRVEERRAEEGMPSDRGLRLRHAVKATARTVRVEVAHGAADDRDAAVPRASELSFETLRQRDVVGVETSDVAAVALVQTAVQRRGEAALLVVAQDPDPAVLDAAKDFGRLVGGRVVDDHELQVAFGLEQHAVHRFAEVPRVVVCREQDRHEWHGASVRPVPLSFDLVVATVGRTDEVRHLLESLQRQTHRHFRVLLVDQNGDDRFAGTTGVERVPASRGLSHARNAALPRLEADLVAFPDDDCTYPDDLLERVAQRFEDDASLGGLTGRDDRGTWPTDRTALTRDNVWNRAISFTIFLRSDVVRSVGTFDERLGLPHSSGEEIDYLIRAIDSGVRIQYDPELVVHHAATERPLVELGARDGESIGYLLRKHEYPRRTVGRMLARPVAGAALALLRRDRERAAFHLETLRGRARGYRT